MIPIHSAKNYIERATRSPPFVHSHIYNLHHKSGSHTHVFNRFLVKLQRHASRSVEGPQEPCASYVLCGLPIAGRRRILKSTAAMSLPMEADWSRLLGASAAEVIWVLS